MYNRYIPQPDGSYRRTKHPDKRSSEQSSRPHVQPTPPQDACKPPPPHEPTSHKRSNCTQRESEGSIKDFFRNILPKDFDTADLLIVLLLLLMAGDRSEDQNTALLTLALYFIM